MHVKIIPSRVNNRKLVLIVNLLGQDVDGVMMGKGTFNFFKKI